MIENHSRIADINLQIREHAIFVGANDVGKTSLLRVLNLVLGCSTSQLYQALTIRDLRQIDRPFVTEIEFADLKHSEWTVFPHETTISPDDHSATLTVRMEIEADPADHESVTIRRWFPDAGSDRSLSREQQAAFGWRYLPASRTASSSQIDGPNSALQALLNGLELGEEQEKLRSLLVDFNASLRTSEALEALRDDIAKHLSRAMPRAVVKEELLVRTASDPTASVLRDVSLFFDRDGEQTPITQQSDGLRQLLLMTLFDLAENSAHTVAIDEPELHLHPSSQRTLATLLQNTRNQKLIVTHSPYVVQQFDPSLVITITADGNCHQIAPDRRNAIERVLAHWWSARLIEVLTARHVVVVEGIADRIVVERAAQVLGINLDRLGVVVFEIDGADKFPNVFKLIGPDGFCIPTYGLVDEKEQGRWLGAFGGKPKNILNKKLWVCKPDLEGEYVGGLGGTRVAEILIKAGVCRENALLQSCDASTVSNLSAESVAGFCRGNKVAAAVAVGEALTAPEVESITSLGSLLACFKQMETVI
ncbi:AAA family ATPase [Pseudonocardia sp. RS11V-5]|nr:AAA family ATPase [Pseudonocardia terrae]